MGSVAVGFENARRVLSRVYMCSVQMSFTQDEVAKHCSGKDCWCILGDDVYDVTKFLAEHPGGAQIFAGKDATEEFDMLHDRKVIKKFGLDQGTVKHIGKLRR